jgi:hypothetical protein
MQKMEMGIREYLAAVAEQLVNELKPILEVKGVTSNTDLLGKYTEASVRSLVHRIVYPMRVSTGAVLDYPAPDPLRQIDLIIWAPFPAPAIYEVEGFGLVPKSSAFGVIEVKRSNYRRADEQLEDFLADAKARKIVSDKVRGLQDRRTPGIGIVCVLDKPPSARLKSLLATEQVVAIFEKRKGKFEVRSKDVLVLVNFLQYIHWRYRVQGAQLWYPVVKTSSL